MATSQSFRVGKVTAYLRGSVWYLRYHENGKRHQVRAADDKKAARQLAAQVNAQLETGAPAATSFQPITIVELRRLWLDHHEHVLRSSVATINRYRTATDHLLNFVGEQSPNKQASRFEVHDAEALVRYLRKLEVAPNGHANAAKRRLRDKGVKYILEVCRSLFNFAIKRRHMPPYAENPFSVIEIDRIPVEDAKPFTDLSPEKEREFLEACDDWQFPIFATLLLTGLRPGELTHLLLPHDVNLHERYIQVRNKPKLGWQVKTRNERRVPLMPELAELLKIHIADRNTGPLFLRRRFNGVSSPILSGCSETELEAKLAARIESLGTDAETTSRSQKSKLAYQVWRDAGAIRTERVRLGYMQVTKKIELPSLTAPKLLRHLFATAPQDGNVDPLIRMQLMGHTANNGNRTGTPLSMTGHYTHTREHTWRKQFEAAMRLRPGINVLQKCLKRINNLRSIKC